MEKIKILVYTEISEFRGQPNDEFTKDSWIELDSDLARKIMSEIDGDSPANSSWHFHFYSIYDAVKIEEQIYLPLNSIIKKMTK